MKFLIQTINGQVKQDFAFHLIQAVDYQNWFANDIIHSVVLSETIAGYPDAVPVGSLEFVFDYISAYHQMSKESIKPINIPSTLRDKSYLERNIYISNKEDIKFTNQELLFVKSNTRYKGFTDIVQNTKDLPNDEYLVSEVVDFASEYRAFVQHGELLDIRNYSGDFTLFPDIPMIKKMIQSYKEAPLSYTLDIGIVKGQTVVVEVHPFVSCGLYGFHGYKRLPSMFIQGYNHLIKEANKQITPIF